MIIGFAGGMGVGKSTAVDVLRASTSRPVFLVKFAQPLYDIQEMVYSRISAVYQRPEDFKKDRKLLQWLGTDWGRDTINPTLWVDLWKAKAEAWLESAPNAIIVCDDVRFDNEAQTISAAGGKVIRLVGADAKDRAHGGEGIKGHSSEAGVSSGWIDDTVFNTGTLENFKAKLCVLYRDLLTDSNK